MCTCRGKTTQAHFHLQFRHPLGILECIPQIGKNNTISLLCKSRGFTCTLCFRFCFFTKIFVGRHQEHWEPNPDMSGQKYVHLWQSSHSPASRVQTFLLTLLFPKCVFLNALDKQASWLYILQQYRTLRRYTSQFFHLMKGLIWKIQKLCLSIIYHLQRKQPPTPPVGTRSKESDFHKHIVIQWASAHSAGPSVCAHLELMSSKKKAQSCKAGRFIHFNIPQS